MPNRSYILLMVEFVNIFIPCCSETLHILLVWNAQLLLFLYESLMRMADKLGMSLQHRYTLLGMI